MVRYTQKSVAPISVPLEEVTFHNTGISLLLATSAFYGLASLNHCKETQMEIFIITPESCAMMYFAGKELCLYVSR